MIAIESIAPQNALVFKEARLRALRDSPSAFGSTYAKESQLSDADWIKRVAQWSGERSIGYLAMDAGIACGIAGAFIDEHDSSRAHLVSMWTAPTHRQIGIARSLVNEILAWARERGVKTLTLMVTSSNEAAISFYERLGFDFTGNTEPYPNDPALVEYEMGRPVS